MHQLTISVPDEKYEAFLEFTKIQQLEITNDEVNGVFEIPEWHKDLVLKRIENPKLIQAIISLTKLLRVKWTNG